MVHICGCGNASFQRVTESQDVALITFSTEHSPKECFRSTRTVSEWHCSMCLAPADMLCVETLGDIESEED